LVLVAVLCGNIEEAAAHCRRLPRSSSADAEAMHKLGSLCAERGERPPAVEHLLQAAKIFLANQDYGSSQRSLASLLALEPTHQEALALQAELVQRAAPRPAAAVTIPSAPAAEPQAAAASDPPRPQVQAFQPSSPVKTTVSNITARLRNLKSGDKDEATGGVTVSRVKGISAKLRSVKQGGAPAQPQSPTPQGGPPGQESAALTAAASRLKTLAGIKAQAMSGDSPPSTPEPAATAPAPDDRAASGAPAEEVSGPPSGAGGVSAEAADKLQEAIAERADNAVAKKKLALGGSASKLAALRKKAQAEA
jgi:hypothetical protein